MTLRPLPVLTRLRIDAHYVALLHEHGDGDIGADACGLTLITLHVIITSMIVRFADADTEAVFAGLRSKRLPTSLIRGAMRKLWMLDAAVSLRDLRVPPGNRLEKLSGRWSGCHSIRINDQWRIRFRWKDSSAHDVEIIDYH